MTRLAYVIFTCGMLEPVQQPDIFEGLFARLLGRVK
jgi:hypothetical protein